MADDAYYMGSSGWLRRTNAPSPAQRSLASEKRSADHCDLQAELFRCYQQPRAVRVDGSPRLRRAVAKGNEETAKSRSSAGHPAQVREVMHAQAACHFAQSLAARREEAAQQPALAELLDPRPPALGIAPEPLEDSGKLGGIAALPSRDIRRV